MKYLGIDYGRRKIGLSIADSESKLAEPYKVISVNNFSGLIEKLNKISHAENISKLVIGVSENNMAEETKGFVRALIEKTNLKIVLHDETLTTKEAQRLSREAGVKQKKRKRMEDAYAATLMLQSYLDES